MQGNDRGIYSSGCKVPGEYKGMQGNARGTYGSGCKVPGECKGMCWVQSVQVMQENAEECQVNVNWWVESARRMEGNPFRVYGSVNIVPVDCWGMPRERMEEGATCQGNAGECRGIPKKHMEVGETVRGCRECRGMPGECRGIQGNARGTYGSGCKVPGNAVECRGIPGECMGVGANCQGNAGVCRGMPVEHMGVGVQCQGNAGNYQVNVRGRV